MLYLIGGENIYESIKFLTKLRKEFLKDEEDGEIRIFNADEINKVEEILEGASSINLFSNKSLIIIKRLSSSRKEIIEGVMDYLSRDKKLDLIVWEDDKIDKRRRIYKYFKKNGVVEEFKLLKFTRLKSWLQKYLKKRVEYESGCASELIFKIGEDQMQLASTVNNLVDLVKSKKGQKLTKKLINKFVDKTAEESIWDLIDAIGAKDKRKAIDIIEYMLNDKNNFSMIIAMIARQLRILTLLKYLSRKGYSQSEMASKLSLHPFVVKKAFNNIGNFSNEKIKKLFSKLLRIDMVVKQGKFEEKMALDLFVAIL